MIRVLVNGIRPLYVLWAIGYYRWALHDLQKKNPHHPDLPLIVLRLRDLRTERAHSNSVVRRAVRWL